MHELTGTVVAIIDSREDAQAAVASLATGQFEAELLHGQEGRAHLSYEEDDSVGLSSVVKRLAIAFGDEMRILDRLDRALEAGRSVISVDVDDDRAADVADILEEHGAHDMWRLGEWSFNRIGGKGSGEG